MALDRRPDPEDASRGWGAHGLPVSDGEWEAAFASIAACLGDPGLGRLRRNVAAVSAGVLVALMLILVVGLRASWAAAVAFALMFVVGLVAAFAVKVPALVERPR